MNGSVGFYFDQKDAAMLLDATIATTADEAHCFVPYPAVPQSAIVAGALTGLRFAVKDIFDVAGFPTGCGNPHMLALSGIKHASAPVVTALALAGARFVGKTYTDELAFSMDGKNIHFGTPRNGGAPQRIPGGSSSGSAAAVSNGLADVALGTDTGGSVRAPASYCGLIGLRPTHGRISLKACMELAPSFDTCGWFARDIDSFARVGDVLLCDDSCALLDGSAGLPQVLVAADALALLAPPVQALFMHTLERLFDVIGTPMPVKTATPSFDALYWAFRHIQGYEAWQSHGATIARHRLQLGPGVAERFAWASQITQQQMEQHSLMRHHFNEDFLRLLGDDRVIVLPSMPDIAPLLSESEAVLENYRNQAMRLLCLAGLSSIIGPRGSDQALIRLSRRFIDVLG